MPTDLIIDTSAYTHFLNGSMGVKAYFTQTLRLYIPRIVLGEIYFGIFNGVRQADNLRNLQTLLASPRVADLDTSKQTAKIYGEIAAELRKSGTPIRQNDIWIAALAKEHGFPLLSFDSGFKHVMGLELILPT